MTIVMFGGKRGGLQAEKHHPNREAQGWQRHVVRMLCCRRVWCTSLNRWHHEVGKWCGYIEATSQDISQESWVANASSKWTMTPSILPKLWQIVKGQQSQGIVVAITKHWPQSHRTYVCRTEKACASKEADKPNSVTPALLWGMGQNSPKLIVGSLWKATWNVYPS